MTGEASRMLPTQRLDGRHAIVTGAGRGLGRAAALALAEAGASITLFARTEDELDAVAGEVREWETVEYARDLHDAGQKKALVLLGRMLSEEPGMNACARWLGTELPDIRVRWIPAGDPYWRPV
jgi:NAD(P)-dependent dehydrogenase (short-subunit alcohol dehydrogenase family)